MNTKKICDKIIELYQDTDDKKKKSAEVIQLVYKMRLDINSKTFTIKSLAPILETTLTVASTKGNFKKVLEENLLKSIADIPDQLWMYDDDDQSHSPESSTQSQEDQIAESLIQFAKKIYEIKVERDSFAGLRRGYAVQILECLSYYFEFPEFMEYCTRSIKSKSTNEYLASIECLSNYCTASEVVPSEEIIEIVDRRIEKTKQRIEASVGLQLQVTTGLISEFEALSRIDEWKEKNGRW